MQYVNYHGTSTQLNDAIESRCVRRVFGALADDPSLVNRDPEGEGWFFKLKLADVSELEGLMDEAAYNEWVKTL